MNLLQSLVSRLKTWYVYKPYNDDEDHDGTWNHVSDSIEKRAPRFIFGRYGNLPIRISGSRLQWRNSFFSGSEEDYGGNQ